MSKPAVRAKIYRVDLDEDPETRWIPVLKDFDPSIITKTINEVLSKFVPLQELRDIVKTMAGEVNRYLPEPYASEIRGISRFWKIELGYVVLLNLTYDITAWKHSSIRACTSIVTNDKSGGLLHARNLDYPLAIETLKKITVDVEFVRRCGEVQYVATTCAGFVGLLTGAKPCAFSLSVDERNVGSWWENLVFALEKSKPTLMLARHVIEESNDYRSALNMLESSKVIAPVYFIVGGTKQDEGSIVVRDRSNTVVVIDMISRNSWYIVETNYDPRKPPPKSDDRRDAAIKAMEEIGQANMDADSLYKVMSTHLVLNPHTISTTIMSASKMSVYETKIRWDAPEDEAEEDD